MNGGPSPAWWNDDPDDEFDFEPVTWRDVFAHEIGVPTVWLVVLTSVTVAGVLDLPPQVGFVLAVALIVAAALTITAHLDTEEVDE